MEEVTKRLKTVHVNKKHPTLIWRPHDVVPESVTSEKKRKRTSCFQPQKKRRTPPPAYSRKSVYPLIHAIIHDKSEEAKKLLADPLTDVNATDGVGKTALMWAIYLQRPRIVEMILDDPNLKFWHVSEDGRNAIEASNYSMRSLKDFTTVVAKRKGLINSMLLGYRDNGCQPYNKGLILC